MVDGLFPKGEGGITAFDHDAGVPGEPIASHDRADLGISGEGFAAATHKGVRNVQNDELVRRHFRDLFGHPVNQLLADSHDQSLPHGRYQVTFRIGSLVWHLVFSRNRIEQFVDFVVVFTQTVQVDDHVITTIKISRLIS
jgi:hypothetical protein